MEYKGLDLSYCQPYNTDFKALKAAGYSFVILRAAYGNTKLYPTQVDSNFSVFYNAATEAGLDVGAYLYSYAKDKAEAIEEAEGLINILAGKRFAYPIYIDIEEKSVLESGKGDEIVEGFCKTLEKAGYFSGVYCSTWWSKHSFSPETLRRFSWWVADWTGNKPDIPFGVWQTGKTKINGAYYDTDIACKDFKAIMQTLGVNGFPIQSTDNTSLKLNIQRQLAAVKADLEALAREVDKL
jgi:GH25 family lysozyme M1 (1,4-beta-N-acetylmuramidase)